VVINGFEQRQIEEFRDQLEEEFKKRTTPAVSGSGVSRQRIYSKD
jgi:hypothetical protein